MIYLMLLSGPNCNFHGQNSGKFRPEFLEKYKDSVPNFRILLTSFRTGRAC